MAFSVWENLSPVTHPFQNRFWIGETTNIKCLGALNSNLVASIANYSPFDCRQLWFSARSLRQYFLLHCFFLCSTWGSLIFSAGKSATYIRNCWTGYETTLTGYTYRITWPLLNSPSWLTHTLFMLMFKQFKDDGNIIKHRNNWFLKRLCLRHVAWHRILPRGYNGCLGHRQWRGKT